MSVLRNNDMQRTSLDTRVFDERRPLDPEFPSMLPSKGEMYPKNGRPDLEHSPPGSAYT